MKRILFYVEPHPIRNYFSDFIDPAILFFEIASHKNFTGIDWKIFSNSFILDDMSQRLIDNRDNIESLSSKEYLSLSNSDILDVIKNKIIYPEVDDDIKIRSLLKMWDENEIQTRNDLVLGIGDITIFYESVLKRIKNKFDFTHIVLWSENGAVRNFCDKAGIEVIHMELGPTRLPFQETIVIDPLGTNANSSLCRNRRPQIKESIDSALWTTDFSKKNNLSVKELYLSPGNIIEAEHISGDVFLTTDGDFSGAEETVFIDNFVVVTLQLTDDLNTINHSKYKTPKEYLQEILPKLLAMGYKVLIKRHPGAIHRIFNLIKELEALEYAKKLSGKVYILPATMVQKEFIILSKNARAILSINSSVSFEAWIIGVPGLIFGNAVFDIDNKLTKLSEDFINGGDLLYNLDYINCIKEDVAYSLNHYLLPKNIFVLSTVLMRVVNSYNKKYEPNFIKWLFHEIDVFEILLNEKILDIESNLSSKSYLDFNKEIANAIPNDGFYQYSIDECYHDNKKLLLRGWAISTKVSVHMIFLEFAGGIHISQMVERPDVKQHFPYAANNSGFEMREEMNRKAMNVKNNKLYIYGSDGICRYIEITL